MVTPAPVPAESLRRDHRDAVVTRLQFLGCRREAHRSPLVGAARVRDHKSVRAGDDVPLTERRVILDVDLCEAELVLAVAGAPRDDLLAVAEGIRHLRIGLSTLRRGIVDLAAVDELGVAGGTEIVAG